MNGNSCITLYNASRTVLDVDLAIADEFMKSLFDICRNLTGSYYRLDVPNTGERLTEGDDFMW